MDNNDKMYKLLASSYANTEGARLKLEAEALDKSGFKYPNKLDSHIERLIKNEKRRKNLIRYMPVAACLIIALILFIGQKNYFIEPSNTMPIADKTPSQKYNLEFISTKLPAKYSVTSIDYDNGKAIYHIENELENKIIMVVEAAESPVNNEGFRAININGTEAYGISKSDYSLLTYEKDNTIYTLTSKYNYLDLIEISTKII